MGRFRSVVTTLVAAAACTLGLCCAPAAWAAPVRVSPGSDVSQPSALCPRIPGRMWCLAERAPVPAPVVTRHGGGMRPDAMASDSDGPYSAAQLRSAYAVPDTTETTTVAVVDAYDAPSVEADLAGYRSAFDLPACTAANGCFRKVDQDGATSPLPAPNSDWAGETTLDVEMVSAICPTCHILLVEADDDDRSGQDNLETAITTAVRLGAHYVSMSWGTGEFPGEVTSDSRYLSAPGVTYVAAAGDSGYRSAWPAVSPGVVSVGGTTLVRDANTSRGWSETVWSNSSGGGTGSGCSPYEPRPAWQQGTPAAAVCSGRAMNDVAMDADPNTGVLVYQGGTWWSYGGTSAGAPMIAAMEAIAGTTANAVSYPYAHPGAFNDVTSGATSACGTVLCQAGPGWDGPTGIGTPNGISGFAPVSGLTSTTPTDPVPPPDPNAPAGPTSATEPTEPTEPTQPSPATITLHDPGTVHDRAGRRVRVDVTATDSAGLPVSYRAAGLPSGTRVDRYGYILGRPRRAGSYRVLVAGRDSGGAVGRVRFTWRVRPNTIVPSRRPHTAGRLRAGHTVRARWGVLRKDSRSGGVIHPHVRVQWYLDGHRIRHATHVRLRLRPRYRGHRISFRVTATATYYTRYVHATAGRGPVR